MVGTCAPALFATNSFWSVQPVKGSTALTLVGVLGYVGIEVAPLIRSVIGFTPGNTVFGT